MKEAALSVRTRSDVSARRILVAECNPNELRQIRSGLEQAGYDVVSVRDGLEACRALTEEPPDVFVCWAMMPGMDGFELLASMRSNTRLQNVPVVMLTTRDARGDVVKPGQIRDNELYLVKPVEMHTLLEAVKSVSGDAATKTRTASGLRCVVDLEM